MKNLAKKLIKFLKEGKSITLTENEVEGLIAIIEQLTIIDTLETIRVKENPDLNYIIEESTVELRRLHTKCSFDVLRKEEKYQSLFWFYPFDEQ